MSEQRSSEWHEERRGLFTSSRFNELMGIKGLGKTGESYAFEMACDIVMGIEVDGYVSFDMQNGIDTEPYAFDYFRAKKHLDFIPVEQTGFIRLNEFTGGSPDGIVDGKYPLEIKCPKRNKFLRLVADNVIDQVYIDQMQHQMWCMDADKAYFLNYITFNGEEYGHEIIVPRDEGRIKLMEPRLVEAVEIREKFINKLKSNLICN